jgi:hypothetical protein
MRKWLVPVLAAAMFVLIAGVAAAQYQNDFESLSASPAGVILTGQDAFYIPTGTTSVDFYAYTYAGNALGVPQNPQGGNQFVGGQGPGDGTTYARAQRDVNFGVGYGVWTITYDFCAGTLQPAPSSNNLGSFSIRYDDLNVHEIHLLSWVDPNNPTTYNAFYLKYDASGIQDAQPGTSPGPSWANLPVNHWFRAWTTLDLDQNLITQVGIIDLETMQQNVFNPTGWYLVGGAAGAPGPPLNFRFFAGGGSTPGNFTAWDNMSIAEAGTVTGACCLSDGTCIITTSDQCQGQFMGEGVLCEPNPCPPVPVEATSWGTIKNSYR